MEFDVVAVLVREALYSLLGEDPDCLDGTERTVTGRLAVHLDRALQRINDDEGYIVDIEYERAGRDVKRLQAEGRLGRKIVPDLLVHRRGLHGGDENLLVVEVKPRRRVAESEAIHDRAKLSLLTGDVRTVFTGGRKYLRFDAVAGDWAVSLPAAISPYRFGAWICVRSSDAELEWFGNLPPAAQRIEGVPTRRS